MLGRKSAGRLMEVKNRINNTLATAKRWPRPLNRGRRWIEVSNTTVYWQINRDFGKCPLNGGWPLNRWPLNRGRTVPGAREALRVKCLAQEHSSISSVRVGSRRRRTNHKATAYTWHRAKKKWPQRKKKWPQKHVRKIKERTIRGLRWL